MKENKKLWTGRTPRRELFDTMKIAASVEGFTIEESLNHVLDNSETMPDGSPKREMLRWWDAASSETQARFLGQVRSAMKYEDRLMGRSIKR